jgi:hypothetical protein
MLIMCVIMYVEIHVCVGNVCEYTYRDNSMLEFHWDQKHVSEQKHQCISVCPVYIGRHVSL